MAIRMYVEHSVIISTLVSHNSVEINLGKKALQLLEGHARFMKCFYGSRTNLSSQASPNFHVRPRLTDGYRFRDSLPIFNSPQAQIADSKFQKRCQLLIRSHDAAMRVCNPDRSPVGINRWDPAPTATGFAEILRCFY